MLHSPIKNATAVCSGGGIYIYYGRLGDGTYFMADDACYEYVGVYNQDPYEHIEESSYETWQKDHIISWHTDDGARQFFKDILSWIIGNKPDGNYLALELEARLSKIN